MATVTIMDPVTRIEGHMKVELTIEQQQIVDARCTGTLFRGFEKILLGRDAWDAPVLTQRICGVCPIAHGQASVSALDQAYGHTLTRNGRVLRNLALGANYLQSHILHFYLLAALDYIKGPQTAPWIPMWEVDLRPGLDAALQHLPQAIEARRRAHEMGAVFTGRMPTAHTFIPGGFTAAPTQDDILRFGAQLSWLTSFIRDVYIADVLAVADVYPDFKQVGAGPRNLLAFGVFPTSDDQTQKLLRSGYVRASAPSTVNTVRDSDITEHVTYSWYADSTHGAQPVNGDTVPQYPKGSAYSWLKAPRLGGAPFEVGALARMWVNGDYRSGVSVIDRHAARALEALKIAEAMAGWLQQVQPGQPAHQPAPTRAPSARGVGLTEAARGALGHWVELTQGRISRYQVITPTCWNASPRDASGVLGPMEQALVGVTVRDPQQPIEALRVIHSFDPCLSCAVHIMKPRGKTELVYRSSASA